MKTRIAYWIFTILLAALMLFSSIPDILGTASAADIVTVHLRYPAYFLTFIGIAKFLGAVAILVPGFPRIKEWAYAGIAYDLIAATYSSVAVGDPAKAWLFMCIPATLFICSYVFYHKAKQPELTKTNNVR
jgi:hypothetical protein